ncbi:acyl-CoA dehydrogenase [Halobacteria archaeon AArc-m2/3/4]|uniref:Acyl-CoA dehydrogenase n=1 Tax=Natronoglomus mannanivorans TaxID=2979990 RepID=A0AAP2Z3N6_9EURY|nr:acyl-CoA dehydrogenase [Halobacteria archaeon AArc-xg1-1]MCU4976002.1 acyl-CoA dehydrogenase [Halobacteria archaeon AArc-m2/3/4]
MNNFKKGSGNLDFGSDSQEESEEQVESETTNDDELSSSDSQTSESSAGDRSSNTDSQSDSDGSGERYPYFVRRNKVGDERNVRLEIHVRKKINEQEPNFRSELAEQLDTDEVSKTDAREFALHYAYQNPEEVADLMRDEGFGILD